MRCQPPPARPTSRYTLRPSASVGLPFAVWLVPVDRRSVVRGLAAQLAAPSEAPRLSSGSVAAPAGEVQLDRAELAELAEPLHLLQGELLAVREPVLGDGERHRRRDRARPPAAPTPLAG